MGGYSCQGNGLCRHILNCWQPMAISAAVPIYTASAPSARHFAKSADVLSPPPAIIDILSLSPYFLNSIYCPGNAAIIGMPTFSLTKRSVAPVPPPKPSKAIKSTPASSQDLYIIFNVSAADFCTHRNSAGIFL